MSKLIFGPGVDYTEATPDAAAVASVSPPKPRRGGLVDMTYDKSEPVLAIHVVYLAAAPTATDTPAAVLDAAPIKGSATPADLAAGGALTITAVGPITPGTAYYVQTILEIAD